MHLSIETDLHSAKHAIIIVISFDKESTKKLGH